MPFQIPRLHQSRNLYFYSYILFVFLNTIGGCFSIAEFNSLSLVVLALLSIFNIYLHFPKYQTSFFIFSLFLLVLLSLYFSTSVQPIFLVISSVVPFYSLILSSFNLNLIASFSLNRFYYLIFAFILSSSLINSYFSLQISYNSFSASLVYIFCLFIFHDFSSQTNLNVDSRLFIINLSKKYAFFTIMSLLVIARSNFLAVISVFALLSSAFLLISLYKLLKTFRINKFNFEFSSNNVTYIRFFLIISSIAVVALFAFDTISLSLFKLFNQDHFADPRFLLGYAYTSSLSSFQDILIGVPLKMLPSYAYSTLSFFNFNPHNTLIQVHASLGIFGWMIIFFPFLFLISKSFKSFILRTHSRVSINLGVLYSSIFIFAFARSLTDSLFLDPLFLFLIYYPFFSIYKSKIFSYS